MHIEVDSDESIGQQARTYAEYRLFAALAPAIGTRRCRRASLVLRRSRTRRRGERVECTVVLELQDHGVARFTAGGDHPYEAINRAVDRIGRSRDEAVGRDAAARKPAQASPRRFPLGIADRG